MVHITIRIVVFIGIRIWGSIPKITDFSFKKKNKSASFPLNVTADTRLLWSGVWFIFNHTLHGI